MTRASGEAMNGTSMATPMNVTAAPRPTRAIPALPNNPAASTMRPNTSTTVPMVARRRREDSAIVASSLMAATGATRDARMDGPNAETTVTRVPATSATMIVRDWMSNDDEPEAEERPEQRG